MALPYPKIRPKNMSDIIIKISKRSYELLKELAKGSNFKKESKHKDGYYYVSIEKEVFEALTNIDDDLDKAIFFAVLNEKVKIKT